MNQPFFTMDYPDIDVIRVEDTYYMITTTMYFMPGGEILSSKDLIHWEHETYVYDRLDSTDGQTLSDGKGIYGKGMWAASLRFYKGSFYVCFVCNDTHKTYLYTASQIKGPWKKQIINGFFHDCSLLFEDDRIFIAYGNRDVYLAELDADLTGIKEGTTPRIIVSDKDNPRLGYEGSHLYKINGKYYLFLIHSLPDRWRRVEACFIADSIDGEFVGGDIFDEDFGYCNQGIAQGGIVDTPDGKWYAVLFQDRGAVGRTPALIQVSWEDEKPVFGNVITELPLTVSMDKGLNSLPAQEYASMPLTPLGGSDDFRQTGSDKKLYGSFGLKSMWQFNHEPDESACELDTVNGTWTVMNKSLASGITSARNTITQRMRYPGCSAEVTLDISEMKDGDHAGLCILQYHYSAILVTKDQGEVFLEIIGFDDPEGERIYERIPVTEERMTSDGKICLRAEADFTDMNDSGRFSYKINLLESEAEGKIRLTGSAWKQLGREKKFFFDLRHFTGCRFALVSYATKETGGKARFSDFRFFY